MKKDKNNRLNDWEKKFVKEVWSRIRTQNKLLRQIIKLVLDGKFNFPHIDPEKMKLDLTHLMLKFTQKNVKL